jgi:cytidylate kinase
MRGWFRGAARHNTNGGTGQFEIDCFHPTIWYSEAVKSFEASHADLMSRCRSFITSAHHTPKEEKKIYPSITLSRLSGAGAFVIGRQLVERLNKVRQPGEPVWTLFDKNLVRQIIEDHHLPKSLESFYSEGVKSHLENIVEEILDLHPEPEQMVEQTSKTIIKLLRKGRVIVIGRAGNIIGSDFDTVTHVRLVASLDFRLKHTVDTCGLSPREARNFIDRADTGRAKYVRRYFGRDIADPLLYNMVLNTESLGLEQSVRLIADTALHRKNHPKSNSTVDIFQP